MAQDLEMDILEAKDGLTQTLAPHSHHLVVHGKSSSTDSPPYETHIIFLIGLLKTALEVFDG